MAAPHLDNPFGAKLDEGEPLQEDSKGQLKSKTKDNQNQKDAKNVKVILIEKPSPICSHPFCNEPSDPSDHPIGLPWASGLLKCLPGYCKKHKKAALDNLLGTDGEESPDEEDEGEPRRKRELKDICKCKDPLLKPCPAKANKPYKKFIYPDDPTVDQELCFFLRMMVVADELDRWDEDDRKKEREEAKKKKEKSKKKKKKGMETSDKDGKKGKQGKITGGKEKDKGSEAKPAIAKSGEIEKDKSDRNMLNNESSGQSRTTAQDEKADDNVETDEPKETTDDNA